jgi:hypothetical protein
MILISDEDHNKLLINQNENLNSVCLVKTSQAKSFCNWRYNSWPHAKVAQELHLL